MCLMCLHYTKGRKRVILNMYTFESNEEEDLKGKGQRQTNWMDRAIY